MRPGRAVVASAAVAAVLALVACSDSGSNGPGTAEDASDGPGDADASVIAPDAVPALMAALPQGTVAPLPRTHLAEEVLPPTNRWYSSLAFGDEALPVFASPLSFRPADGGFSFGLPRVVATPSTIFGSARDDIAVAIDGAVGRPMVSAAGPIAVELEYAMPDADAAAVNLAAGWPVVALTAADALTARLSVPLESTGSGLAVASVDGTEYGVRVNGGAVDGTELTLDAGGSAQFFAVPSGGDAASFAAALGGPVTSVVTSYATPAVASAGDVSTTVTYLSGGSSLPTDAGPTVIAVPTSRDASSDCTLGTYDTINGPLAVCAQAAVTWSVPALPTATSLDLEGITSAQREAIANAVSNAASSSADLPADTYFGTKALYRLANLKLLAEALGQEAEDAALTAQLVEALEVWTEPAGCEVRADRCFQYDPEWRGVVGLTPAFGSEQFNDHHFHYGYLLYAAAVAGADDPGLVERMAPVLDAVAADIAAFPGSRVVPESRVFDPFAGHSWASGTAPFGDGNNQESSSEAVTAWLGLGAWAAVRGDGALESAARWMTALEADAATRVWLRPNLDAFPEYDHSIVALQWGGKRDYATWFSPDPGAMLGIQLIPAPASAAAYLSPRDEATAQAIRDAVTEGAPAGFGVQFGDYMLMYQALAGADDAAAAWDAAVTLEDEWIDDGNSRAYMLAWIASASAGS